MKAPNLYQLVPVTPESDWTFVQCMPPLEDRPDVHDITATAYVYAHTVEEALDQALSLLAYAEEEAKEVFDSRERLADHLIAAQDEVKDLRQQLAEATRPDLHKVKAICALRAACPSLRLKEAKDIVDALQPFLEGTQQLRAKEQGGYEDTPAVVVLRAALRMIP